MLEQEAAHETEDRFASLVTRQSHLVFRIAYAVLRNVEDAEDVTQETFLKLFRSGSWQDMKDEKAFLARMVWRLAVNKRPTRWSSLAIEPTGIPSGGKSPEREAILSERSLTIHRLVESLPERLKRPLILSSFKDLTTSEIATVMELPEGTVRRLISEARALIKEKMARMEGQR